MRSEVAQQIGETRLTFVQGVAMMVAGLTFGGGAGIGYAAGELDATTCVESAGSKCATLQSLEGTTYGLLGIAVVALVAMFGTHVLLEELEENSRSPD